MRLLLVGLLLVAVGLAGCGQSSESAEPPTPNEPASDVPQEPPQDEPAPPEPAPQVPEPPELPNLYELPLDVDELPAGTGIDDETLVGSFEALSGFRRNFAVQGRKLGSSEPVELHTDLLLFSDEAAAAAVMQAIRERLAGEAVTNGFGAAVMESLGINVDGVVVKEGSFPDLGSDTVATQASFDTAAGRAEGLLVVSQVSVFINFLWISTPEGMLDGADVGALTMSAISRLEAETERVRDQGGLPEPGRPLGPGEGTA